MIYINSKGQEMNTEDIATPHLERALAKSIREGKADNVVALEAELASRENK